MGAQLHAALTIFCFNGTVKTGDFFTPNHFVPLIVEEIGNKRKQNNVSSVTVKKPFPSESFRTIQVVLLDYYLQQ